MRTRLRRRGYGAHNRLLAGSSPAIGKGGVQLAAHDWTLHQFPTMSGAKPWLSAGNQKRILQYLRAMDCGTRNRQHECEVGKARDEMFDQL